VTKVTFNVCSLNVPTNTFTGYYTFDANDCTFFNASRQNTTGDWITGSNNRFYSIPRFGPYGDSEGTFYDQYAETYTTYGIVDDKDFIGLEGDTQYMQIAYVRTKITNSNILPIYWVTKSADGHYPDIYVMENTYMKFSNSYQWNIRHYGYNYDASLRFDFLNINSEDPNNIKRVINNSLVNCDDYFYRRLEFNVQGNGEMLIGVGVNIIDNERE
jgi:hypothetical protein